MKFFFLLLFAPFISCTNPFVNPIRSELPASAPSVFKCDYENQKIACKKIIDSSWPQKIKQLTNSICDSLIPCWYGTAWNFYGTSETPGKGNIACGYFVTTIIRDAGLPVKRVKMAQCASEEMIRNLCEKTSIKRYRNKNLNEFVAAIKLMGYGLYIIGLDNHTGFIYNDGKEIYFIHSSYATPKCVIKEIANSSSVLASSKYRVIGKLKI